MVVLLVATLSILGCNKIKNKNGWYYVADNQTKEWGCVKIPPLMF